MTEKQERKVAYLWSLEHDHRATQARWKVEPGLVLFLCWPSYVDLRYSCILTKLGRIVIYQETHQPVKKRHCFLAFTCVSKDSQCPSTVADTCTFRQFTGLPFSKKRRDRVIAVGKCCLLIGDYMSKNQIRWVSDRTTRQIIPFWRSKLGS